MKPSRPPPCRAPSAHPVRAGLGALALALAGSGLGCDLALNDGSTATLTYTEDSRAAYNEAMAAFKAREWEDARALFLEVKRLFAYSRYSRLAELRLADIDFEQEKFTDAIAAYRDFVQNHRTDRDIEYARYRICKALFLDIDDTLLLPPQEERDQATTLEAFKELRTFLREFPRTRYRTDASYMLDVVTGRLVRHELYVARYYMRKDVYEASLARAEYALKAYPGSGLDAEAMVLKGETLLKMKRRDEARVVFTQVIRDYGGPFATTAKDFLDEMGVGPASSVPPATSSAPPGRPAQPVGPAPSPVGPAPSPPAPAVAPPTKP